MSNKLQAGYASESERYYRLANVNTELQARIAELEGAMQQVYAQLGEQDPETAIGSLENIANIIRSALASDGSAYGDFMKAAKRLREQMEDEHIEIARENRKLVHGSSGTDIIARALDPEAWQNSGPVPTRGSTVEWHRRCQESALIAQAIERALDETGLEIRTKLSLTCPKHGPRCKPVAEQSETSRGTVFECGN